MNVNITWFNTLVCSPAIQPLSKAVQLARIPEGTEEKRAFEQDSLYADDQGFTGHPELADVQRCGRCFSDPQDTTRGEILSSSKIVFTFRCHDNWVRAAIFVLFCAG